MRVESYNIAMAEPEPEPEIIAPTSNRLTRNVSQATLPKNVFAEPVPDIEKALELYGWGWKFHIYFVGTLFAILALYSCISLIRLRKKRLMGKGYFIALNVIMVVMGLSRTVYLFVDAYNFEMLFSAPVAYMLLGMGFPCLTSAFSILFLALLQSTRIQLVPPSIQKPSYLAIIITVHFLISFVADLLLGFFSSAFFLTLICQLSFVIWGLTLSISYMCIFKRLYKSTIRQYRDLVRLSITKGPMIMAARSANMRIPRNSWGSAIKLTLGIAFMGILTALLQVYGIVVVYGPVGGNIPEPWPWYGYQLLFRLVELAMCFSMSYVATQPFRHTADGKEKPSICARICHMICGERCSCKKQSDFDHIYEESRKFEEENPNYFLPKTELNNMDAKTASFSQKETQIEDQYFKNGDQVLK